MCMAHDVLVRFLAIFVLGLLGTLPIVSADTNPPSSASGGVWTVQGEDAIGTFTGKVELIAESDGYRFIRVIDYAKSVKVEDGRSLSWVWEGRAIQSADGSYQISIPLTKADFIRSRGNWARGQSDSMPALIEGTFTPKKNKLVGTYSGEGIQASETWGSRKNNAAQPIFLDERKEVDTHPVIPPDQLQTFFGLFSSYHALPEVQPYVTLPKFLNPIHTVILDPTDFGYYQKRTRSLRVVNKVVDPISLQETQARADAYKWKLRSKANYYDKDTETSTIDPDTGMLFEFVDDAGRGEPSHDSALWTAAYMASQYYRSQVSNAGLARKNISRSADGLLKLVEITGNPHVFARTLRKATGAPTPPWNAGTASLSHLEWKSGGNNDMFKGLMYGYATTQAALCGRHKKTYQSICDRLQTNVVQIVNQLDIAQEHGQNRLAALWLAAAITQDAGYRDEAIKEWRREAINIANGNTTMVYNYGVADWSGTHLTAVQFLNFRLLTQLYPLPDIDTISTLNSGMEKLYREFNPVRPGLLSVAFSVLAEDVHPDAAEAARWRLRELPVPKLQIDEDHRISSSYVMSPFPSAPWKMDWDKNDRTQSLRSYPLFEATAYTVYDWKQSPFEYRGANLNRHYPGVDYLLAYWLGRSLKVFSATE